MAVTEDYTAADTKVYAFAERYRSSAELRARIDSGDVSEALNELGVSLRDGVEARIVGEHRRGRLLRHAAGSECQSFGRKAAIRLGRRRPRPRSVRLRIVRKHLSELPRLRELGQQQGLLTVDVRSVRRRRARDGLPPAPFRVDACRFGGRSTANSDREGTITLEIDDYIDADAKVYAFAERYWSEPDVRERIESGDLYEALEELGVSLQDGAEARVVANTGEVVYFAMPPDPNTDLADEGLDAVAGGAGTTSAVPLSSASTASTIPSCLGCASSVSTVQDVLPDPH